MKRHRDLSTLLSLVEMRYNAQNRAFQKIVAEENQIRAELQKIDNQSRIAEEAQNPQMQSIGADVIWKAWVGRTKRALNIKLAQVLANKEHHLRQVKRAYGKVLVTRELTQQQLDEQRYKSSQTQLESAMTHSFETKNRR